MASHFHAPLPTANSSKTGTSAQPCQHTHSVVPPGHYAHVPTLQHALQHADLLGPHGNTISRLLLLLLQLLCHLFQSTDLRLQRRHLHTRHSTVGDHIAIAVLSTGCLAPACIVPWATHCFRRAARVNRADAGLHHCCSPPRGSPAAEQCCTPAVFVAAAAGDQLLALQQHLPWLWCLAAQLPGRLCLSVPGRAAAGTLPAPLTVQPAPEQRPHRRALAAQTVADIITQQRKQHDHEQQSSNCSAFGNGRCGNCVHTCSCNGLRPTGPPNSAMQQLHAMPFTAEAQVTPPSIQERHCTAQLVHPAAAAEW